MRAQTTASAAPARRCTALVEDMRGSVPGGSALHRAPGRQPLSRAQPTTLLLPQIDMNGNRVRRLHTSSSGAQSQASQGGPAKSPQIWPPLLCGTSPVCRPHPRQ